MLDCAFCNVIDADIIHSRDVVTHFELRVWEVVQNVFHRRALHVAYAYYGTLKDICWITGLIS